MQQEERIPIKQHSCQAKETMETLTGKVDLLRRDLRTMERQHEEDIRKLWIRIAALTALICALTEGENIALFLVSLLTG